MPLTATHKLGNSSGLLEKNPAAIIAPQISELPRGYRRHSYYESGDDCLTFFLLVAGRLERRRRNITGRVPEPFVIILTRRSRRRVFVVSAAGVVPV